MRLRASSVFVWQQPDKNRYVLHVVNELSSTGLTGLQRVDRVPVSATVRIAWPGVKTVKQAVGSAACKITRTGRHWTVQLDNLADRAVLVCQR